MLWIGGGGVSVHSRLAKWVKAFSRGANPRHGDALASLFWKSEANWPRLYSAALNRCRATWPVWANRFLKRPHRSAERQLTEGMRSEHYEVWWHALLAVPATRTSRAYRRVKRIWRDNTRIAGRLSTEHGIEGRS